MADYEEFPEALRPILLSFSEAVDALMADFRVGKITLDEWRDKFAQLLALYISSSYLTGSEQEDIIGDAAAWVAGWLAVQLDYLNGFRDAIQANLAAGGEYSLAWETRARMYVPATVAPYWYGATEGLPLPAYPGDLSSPCGESCACLWDIQWDDQEAGDCRAYWRLNGIRYVKPPDHCQTCVERAHQWNPLVIRGWRLVIPAAATSGGPYTGKSKKGRHWGVKHKHMEGRHDQKRHAPFSLGRPEYDAEGRPANLAATTSYKRSRKNMADAREYWDSVVGEGLMDEVGLTQRQAHAWMKGAVRDVQRVCDEGIIRTRVPESRLESILEDGRMKSQHETHSSGGFLGADVRSRAEERGMGTPYDLNPAERPIYGYLYHPDMSAHVYRYGEIALELKPEVRRRTTITYGDSLGGFDERELFASPINHIEGHALGYNALGPLTYAGKRGGGRKPRAEEWMHFESYIEAQFHGQVRREDIARVIIGPHASYLEELERLLEEYGIPWDYEDDSF